MKNIKTFEQFSDSEIVEEGAWSSVKKFVGGNVSYDELSEEQKQKGMDVINKHKVKKQTYNDLANDESKQKAYVAFNYANPDATPVDCHWNKEKERFETKPDTRFGKGLVGSN